MLHNNGRVCALGSLGSNPLEARRVGLGLKLDFNKPKGPWDNVADLNNNFKGSPAKRRNYMLGHLVKELRHRKLNLSSRLTKGRSAKK